jgi:hypothetical protein
MVVYIYYIQQLEIPTARSWAAPARATGTVRKRQAIRPVDHVQILTCRVNLLQPARRAAVLGLPSSLRSHWVYELYAVRVRTKLIEEAIVGEVWQTMGRTLDFPPFISNPKCF